MFFKRMEAAKELAIASASNLISGKKALATPDEFQYRMNICQSCDEYRTMPERCEACGCILFLKARLSEAQCPLDKWFPTTEKTTHE